MVGRLDLETRERFANLIMSIVHRDEIATKYHLSIPPDLFLMIKTLSTVEGLGLLLDPDLDVVEQATPFMRRIQFNRLHPRRMAADMSHSGTQLFHLLKDIPVELRAILKLARRGRIKIEFEHCGLEPLIVANNRINNRLSFAIVLTSLLIPRPPLCADLSRHWQTK